MSDFNDCKREALKRQGAPYMNISDMEHFVMVGLTGKQGHLEDLWHLYWDEANIPKGTFNDRAMLWLFTLGYTERSLTDRWFHFWCDNARNYSHLEDHPRWSIIDGTGPSNFSVDGRQFYVYNSPGMADIALAYTNNSFADVTLQTRLRVVDTIDEESLSYFMTARMDSASHYVGAAIWKNKVVIYERNLGSWAAIISPDTAPNLADVVNKRLRLIVSGNQASLDVDGTHYPPENNLTVLNSGRIGMVAREHLLSEMHFMSGFRVVFP